MSGDDWWGWTGGCIVDCWTGCGGGGCDWGGGGGAVCWGAEGCGGADVLVLLTGWACCNEGLPVAPCCWLILRWDNWVAFCIACWETCWFGGCITCWPEPTWFVAEEAVGGDLFCAPSLFTFAAPAFIRGDAIDFGPLSGKPLSEGMKYVVDWGIPVVIYADVG